MKIDGGCHCGYITYAAEIDPEKVGICHCTDCQTLSGTAFRVSAPAAKGAEVATPPAAGSFPGQLNNDINLQIELLSPTI